MLSSTACRRAVFNSSALISPPSMNLSVSDSLVSAICSIITWRRVATSSLSSSGTSDISRDAPNSSVQRMSDSSIRSTTPLNFASSPTGICTAIGLAARRSRIISIVRSKDAPTRSILLTKQIRGTRYKSACRQTVSDCGSTPWTASNTTTPPSSTRNDRCTSAVKSICPGVSMRLIT